MPAKAGFTDEKRGSETAHESEGGREGRGKKKT